MISYGSVVPSAEKDKHASKGEEEEEEEAESTELHLLPSLLGVLFTIMVAVSASPKDRQTVADGVVGLARKWGLVAEPEPTLKVQLDDFDELFLNFSIFSTESPRWMHREPRFRDFDCSERSNLLWHSRCRRARPYVRLADLFHLIHLAAFDEPEDTGPEGDWYRAVSDVYECERWAAPIFGGHDPSRSAIRTEISRPAGVEVWGWHGPSYGIDHRKEYPACTHLRDAAIVAHERVEAQRSFIWEKMASERRNASRAEYQALDPASREGLSFEEWLDREDWCAPHRSALMTHRRTAVATPGLAATTAASGVTVGAGGGANGTTRGYRGPHLNASFGAAPLV